MARLNVYVPDQLAETLKEHREVLDGSLSQICTDALRTRLSEIAESVGPLKTSLQGVSEAIAAQMPSATEVAAQHRGALAEVISQIPMGAIAAAQQTFRDMESSGYLEAVRQANAERERMLAFVNAGADEPVDESTLRDEVRELRAEIRALRAELRDLRGGE